MNIGFIGLGNMATAMMGGILNKGIVSAEEIYGSDALEAAVNKAKEGLGIHATTDNLAVVEAADILIISVKPQFYQTVIRQIKDRMRESQIVVSIAPGKTISWLEEQFEKQLKVVRCMPNTPALVGAGCTGVCHNAQVSKEEMEVVLSILRSFGVASIVPEHLMDVVVGVSGSSPAYVFMFIEAMADAAVADGMPRAQAYEFAAQAVYGSAKMLLETGVHPAELKDMVCSPGGTTIVAVKELEKNGFRSAVIEAQMACVEKSRNL